MRGIPYGTEAGVWPWHPYFISEKDADLTLFGEKGGTRAIDISVYISKA